MTKRSIRWGEAAASVGKKGLEGVTTSASLPQLIIEPSAQITNNPIASLPGSPNPDPIAPTEPDAQPTAPPPTPIAPSELEPEFDAELVAQIADTLRKAISVNDAVAVREAAKTSINLDKTGRLKAAVRNCLTTEENEACRILLANLKQSQSEPIQSGEHF